MPYNPKTGTLIIDDYIRLSSSTPSSEPGSSSARNEFILYGNTPPATQPSADGEKKTLIDFPRLNWRIGDRSFSRPSNLRGTKVFFRTSLPKNPRDYHPLYCLIDNYGTDKEPQWQLFYTDADDNTYQEVPIEAIPHLPALLMNKNLTTLSQEEKKQIETGIVDSNKEEVARNLLIDSLAEAVYPKDKERKAALIGEIQSGSEPKTDEAKLVLSLLANLNQNSFQAEGATKFSHAMIAERHHQLIDDPVRGKRLKVSVERDHNGKLFAQVRSSTYYLDAIPIDADNPYTAHRELTAKKERLLKILLSNQALAEIRAHEFELQARAEEIADQRAILEIRYLLQPNPGKLLTLIHLTKDELDKRLELLISENQKTNLALLNLAPINSETDLHGEQFTQEVINGLRSELQGKSQFLEKEISKFTLRCNIIMKTMKEEENLSELSTADSLRLRMLVSLLDQPTPSEAAPTIENLLAARIFAQKATEAKRRAAADYYAKASPALLWNAHLLEEIEAEAYAALHHQAHLFVQRDYDTALRALDLQTITLHEITHNNPKLSTFAKQVFTFGMSDREPVTLDNYLKAIEALLDKIKAEKLADLDDISGHIQDSLARFYAASARREAILKQGLAITENMQSILNRLNFEQGNIIQPNKIALHTTHQVTMGEDHVPHVEPLKSELIVRNDLQRHIISSLFEVEFIAHGVVPYLIDAPATDEALKALNLTAEQTIFLVNCLDFSQLPIEKQKVLLTHCINLIKADQQVRNIALSIKSSEALNDGLLERLIDSIGHRLVKLELINCKNITAIKSARNTTPRFNNLTELIIRGSPQLKSVSLSAPSLQGAEVDEGVTLKMSGGTSTDLIRARLGRGSPTSPHRSDDDIPAETPSTPTPTIKSTLFEDEPGATSETENRQRPRSR